ncbi:MAG: hypothetical protein KKC72_02335, partial [Alphaproteobacteria bacterium]|nr:hypothetical protein [Alphaproteobacteria bacterium]
MAAIGYDAKKRGQPWDQSNSGTHSTTLSVAKVFPPKPRIFAQQPLSAGPQWLPRRNIFNTFKHWPRPGVDVLIVACRGLALVMGAKSKAKNSDDLHASRRI